MPRTRLVFVAATLSILLTMPVASARTSQSPRPGTRAEVAWFDAAVTWLEGAARLFRPASPAVAKTTTGGSCIDPQGRPIFPCPK